MSIEIKKSDITAIVDFLYKLNLSELDSIRRTRIIKYLEKHVNQIQKDYVELLRLHTGVDEDTPLDKIDQDMIKDKDKFIKNREELFAETLIIEDGNIIKSFDRMKEILPKLTEKWSGRDADAYFALFEALKIDI